MSGTFQVVSPREFPVRLGDLTFYAAGWKLSGIRQYAQQGGVQGAGYVTNTSCRARQLVLDGKFCFADSPAEVVLALDSGSAVFRHQLGSVYDFGNGGTGRAALSADADRSQRPEPCDGGNGRRQYMIQVVLITRTGKAYLANGIAAFTGDGTNPDVMTMATKAIGAAGGCGVPTIKPWNIDTVKAKMEQAKASGCFAVAMDVDAAGLPFLKNMTPPAGSKSVAELAEIVKLAERPFIVKGVMTVKGALKAKEAGAAAIVVSNHGGRVLDQCPATAEVLPEIAEALKGSGVKILVDGGIRSGVDVFKALALGADAVLICRPFVTAVYGGGEEGVKCYIDKIAAELADTMQMCGAHSLAEITRDMVRI